MGYCTVADVELNLDGFEIDAVAGDDTTLTDAQVESFIIKADSEINSILANVYTLPFTVDIPMLKSISTDLACYYILRRNYTRDHVETSDWVDQFKRDADAKLDEIKDNKISLVDEDGNVIEYGSSLVQDANENYTSTFDEGDPLDWEVDSDKLEDIADAKT